MFNSLKARFALIAALVLLSVWMVVDRGITLGLDLRGGTHLALEIDDPEGALTVEQRSDAIDRALTIIRTRVDELGVAEPAIQKVGDDRIVVELPGATQEDQLRAKEVIQQTAFLQFQIVQPSSELAGVVTRLDRAVVDALGAEALEAGDTAVSPTGVGGLFEAAGDTAAAETTAADTAAAGTGAGARPFSSKLIPLDQTGQTAQFAVAMEDVPEMERYLALDQVQALLPRGTELVWGFEEDQAGPAAAAYRPLYLLEERPLMTGEFLEDAQAQRDPQFGQPQVLFQLSRRGGRVFERGTGENIGNLMAIVLDDRVFSAPIINGQIADRGQIDLSGGTIEEARDLALVLRAGSLPAPISIVEERSIGPSLGADSIEQGRLAGIIGIVLVIGIIGFYYRISGLMAVAALTLYVSFLLGALAGIDATLTLPGIAGIVLSIGMAVDANVLIFERIREELDAGRSARVAVSEGFSNALSAIVDSQLTTLLTALVLFQFGTGPIRGFAVTLGIGIVASLFTAIFVTRTFFMLYLDRRPAAQGVSI
jgi:preprotein translocase subunit SecD